MRPYVFPPLNSMHGEDDDDDGYYEDTYVSPLPRLGWQPACLLISRYQRKKIPFVPHKSRRAAS